jgi:hypothetical protein
MINGYKADHYSHKPSAMPLTTIARCLWVVAGCWALMACSGMPQSPQADSPPRPAPLQQLPLHFSAKDIAQWDKVVLPGKLRTAYKLERQAQGYALQAQAESSASMLRQRLRIAPEQLGHLTFDWRVERLIPGADMQQRESEDSPVRLILVFEGDRQQFSPKNAMLSELTHSLTGEPMPYATLMYVWCNQCPPESVIVNPRTDRIRKIVVDSGPTQLRRWREHRRDLGADFRLAFGEEPGALTSIALMTDSDNMRSSAASWYGPVEMH